MALHRLSKPEDFTKTYREGKSRSHPLLTVYFRPNSERYIRVGYVAGRKVGGAVERNRAKRLLREATRATEPLVRPGHDLVFVAHRSMVGRSARDVREGLEDVLRRAGLLERSGE